MLQYNILPYSCGMSVKYVHIIIIHMAHNSSTGHIHAVNHSVFSFSMSYQYTRISLSKRIFYLC